jgi:hypothetical protein
MQAGYVSLDHVELLADAYRAEHAAVWDRVIPLIVEFVDGSRFADVARHVQDTINRLGRVRWSV